MGRQHGVAESDLQALADHEVHAWPAAEAAALHYAEAMTQTHVRVPDDLFTELRKHWDPRQVIELTAAIAWENYRARFNHALAVEAEGFSEGAFCPLPAPVGKHSAPSPEATGPHA